MRLSFVSRGIAAAALVAASVWPVSGAHAATTTIDFEGSGAPCCFALTSPLSNAYAGLGVNFSGVGGTGGYILNQSGGFGFNAHSGTDFLAFNTSQKGISGVEDISLSTPVSAVSIWAADRYGSVVSLSAYDAGGALLASASITGSSNWQQLSVSGVGIASVRLSGGQVYAVDDLAFTGAVPEPEVYAMVLGGLAVMGVMARRRRSA